MPDLTPNTIDRMHRETIRQCARFETNSAILSLSDCAEGLTSALARAPVRSFADLAVKVRHLSAAILESGASDYMTPAERELLAALLLDVTALEAASTSRPRRR